MTIPTAVDYAWFDEDDDRALTDNYCLSLVKEISAEELIRRLGGSISGQVDGFEAVYEFWAETIEIVAGITKVDDWTLMVETSGGMGVTPNLARTLSQGTMMVAHAQSVNAVYPFLYVSDGNIILEFDSLYPTIREGSDPDGLLEVMEQVGFDMNKADSSPSGVDHANPGLAAFALAEYITGVRITPDVLDVSNYWIATFPDCHG